MDATFFSRVIQGARISLIVGLCGALVSFFIGTTYGLISGYAGGRTDNLMMRFVEVLHSVPRLIIVIVAIFSFAPWLEKLAAPRALPDVSKATRK